MTGEEGRARIKAFSEPLSPQITLRTALESNPSLHGETLAIDA
jgi:hypothetical protein